MKLRSVVKKIPTLSSFPRLCPSAVVIVLLSLTLLEVMVKLNAKDMTKWCRYKQKTIVTKVSRGIFSGYTRIVYTRTEKLVRQICPQDKQDCCSESVGCCDSAKMTTYLIAFGVVAGVLAIGCAVGVGIYMYKRKKNRAAQQSRDAYPLASGYMEPPPGYASAPGYPPPQQGYPLPQQGYPPPQQGYPLPQQGYQPPPQDYPPPPQGYPPQPQGYPPQPQGYPVPQQGYPPPQ